MRGFGANALTTDDTIVCSWGAALVLAGGRWYTRMPSRRGGGSHAGGVPMGDEENHMKYGRGR